VRLAALQVPPGHSVEFFLAEETLSTLPCTLTSLPVLGTLTLPSDIEEANATALTIGSQIPNCRVHYTANDDQAWDNAALGGLLGGRNRDGFTYVVEADGRESTAVVHRGRICEPLGHRTLVQNNVLLIDPIRLPLGGACTDGLRPQVEIVSMPRGMILLSLRSDFDLLDILSLGSSPGGFLGADPSTLAQFFSPIFVAPANVTNDSGYVIIIPNGDITESTETYLEYRWLSPFADPHRTFRMPIRLDFLGSAIELLPPLQEVNETTGTSVELTLRASSSNSADGQQPENAVFDVTRGPYFGTLYQVCGPPAWLYNIARCA
jgi:hypothetical protein